MSRPSALGVAVLSLVVSFSALAVSPAYGATPPSEPHIEVVYPNPVFDEDAGEFVVVEFPAETGLSNWSVSDGESTVSLGNRTVSGRVAFAAEANRTAKLTNTTVRALPSFPNLANGGDELELRHENTTVDSVSYEDAPEGELGRVGERGLRWTPLGATSFPPIETGSAKVRPFVLPDDPGVPVETIAEANRRILLAGYTFASERVAKELKRAIGRGVEVRVLVDDAPVGGVTEAEKRTLDGLAAEGVDVEVIGGDRARYDYHHPKYAVVDSSAIVTSENWKPAGTGGHSSRGWGVVVDDNRTASALAGIFRADADWRDTRSWERFSANLTPVEEGPANGTFPSHFEPGNRTARDVTLLAAPDNAERREIGLIDNATDSVRVIQPTIGSFDQSLLSATVRAAERGLDVKVLLSNAWYDEDRNTALVDRLDTRAKRENLSLAAKIVEPNSRFEKIHAKGLLVDGDQVVLGSLNWNDNSARENREVAVVLDGESIAGYYANVFESDWSGGTDGKDPMDWFEDSSLPAGLLGALVGVAVLVFMIARRLRFLE